MNHSLRMRAAMLSASAVLCTVASADDSARGTSAASRKGFSTPVEIPQLETYRGGAVNAQFTDQQLTATVSNNVASHLSTGSNTISEGSFSGMTGLPMVIQNTGNNVLIQNATVLNVTVK